MGKQHNSALRIHADGDELRINIVNVSMLAALGVFPLLLSTWLLATVPPISESIIRLFIMLLSGGSLIAGFRVLWNLVREVGTRIDNDNVSRPCLFNRQVIAWDDVDGMAFAGQSACGIYAGRQSILIHFHLYANPASIADLLHSKAKAANIHTTREDW